MAGYPMFLNLAGRRVVVIGGGTVAARKAQGLLSAGARVILVAEDFDEPLLKEIFKGTDTQLIKSKYSKDYLGCALLVIAATNDRQLNEEIYKDCQELEILCNVVDQPGLCDFFVPAVVRRGDLQIAVGTEGDCPAYAGHIRRKIEEAFTDEHGDFLAELESVRKYIASNVDSPAERKSLLGQLVKDESFEYFRQNGAEAWQEYAEKIIERGNTFSSA
jgi:precorrin-2 dehydrogenase/sirohydrochlorin ferrochelatase